MGLIIPIDRIRKKKEGKKTAEYIEREEFIAEQRHLYCDNCARRKNSKGKLVYDIGDAPCRSCGICDVLDAVEDAPAADVREVVRGKWIVGKSKWSVLLNSYTCPFCGGSFQNPAPMNYCSDCGAEMTEPPKEET